MFAGSASGVMTVTFGGVIRDVLCAEVLTLMRPELYISCALLGATTYIGLMLVGINESLSASLAFLAVFGLRAVAILFSLTLPKFNA